LYDSGEGGVALGIKGNINEKLYCQSCKQKTNHGYVEKYEMSSSQFRDCDFQFLDQYFITKCLGCDTIAFFREYGDENMINQMGEWYKEQYVYPEEPQTELEYPIYEYDIKEFKNAPDKIQELYRQVVSCFESMHYLLVAVGLRMIIEGLCNDRSIIDGYLLDEKGNKKLDKKRKELRSKSLEGRINGMEEDKLITPVSAKVLQQIRELGNTTVHELKVPNRSTIKKGLNIIEDLIKTVYEYENIKI